MSLIDRHSWDRLLAHLEPTRARPVEDADGGDGRCEIPGPGNRPPPAHLVVYNDPACPVRRYGLGWTLITRHHPRWCISMSLAARGAGADAPTRVAQAVAVRVLVEQGWIVDTWIAEDDHDTGPGEQAGLVVFRARLRQPAAPSAADLRPAFHGWVR
ncbi:MAG TPA: hypothetical protein VK935_08780 [Actinomycetospora sp.]|nr:hypothetical protein [Actinomycetospora sp.]